ncbi:unnamed protein product [Arctogadus glacialis]
MSATQGPMYPDQSNFHYDYETLRTTGVILATVLAVSGILIAMSKKFTNCVKSSSKTPASGTPVPKTEDGVEGPRGAGTPPPLAAMGPGPRSYG